MRAALIAAMFLSPALAQQVEIEIGRQLAREIERQYKLRPDPALSTYARDLAAHFTQSAGLKIPLAIKVLDSPEPGVFLVPGGLLYITTGLIAQTETEAEFAGALAHAIAHIALKNASAWLPGCARWTLKNKMPLGLLAGQQKVENHADSAAVQYLRTAGYDPLGMIEFFNKLPYRQPRESSPAFSHDLMTLHSYVEESVPPDPAFIVNTAAFDAIRKPFLPEPKPVALASRPTLTRVSSR